MSDQTLSPRCPPVTEIQAVLDSVADSVQKGKGPAAVCDLLYADDALVVGEGLPEAVSGREGCISLLTEVLNEWGPGARVEYAWHDPIVGSVDTVSAMIQIKVTPADQAVTPFLYRVLYVWCRGTRGWRVTLEVFGLGHL